MVMNKSAKKVGGGGAISPIPPVLTPMNSYPLFMNLFRIFKKKIAGTFCFLNLFLFFFNYNFYLSIFFWLDFVDELLGIISLFTFFVF